MIAADQCEPSQLLGQNSRYNASVAVAVAVASSVNIPDQ
ncbi:Unknown protein sequence [Pseudomonas amygdali pv. lachrymans]|nr:Unknown protein sequence [Pseudomonas amygdali pv. lachrymans]